MKKNNNQNNNFIRSAYSHTMVSAVIVNGKKEKFNANEKLIYGYLLGWSNTVKETGGTIHPDRIDIGLHCGIERLATVDECLKRLKSKGLISWVKGKGKGVANVYTVYDIATVECVYPDYAKQLSGTNYNHSAETTSAAEPLPVEICESMPEQEPRIKAALPPGNNEQPDNKENADMDLDELLKPQGNENGNKQGEPPQEEREEEYTYRFTKTKVPIPSGIDPDDINTYPECPF